MLRINRHTRKHSYSDLKALISLFMQEKMVIYGIYIYNKCFFVRLHPENFRNMKMFNVITEATYYLEQNAMGNGNGDALFFTGFETFYPSIF